MTPHNTQPQHDELDQLWAELVNSHGATVDLLGGLRRLIQVNKALLRYVDELQGEVYELRELNEKN